MNATAEIKTVDTTISLKRLYAIFCKGNDGTHYRPGDDRLVMKDLATKKGDKVTITSKGVGVVMDNLQKSMRG